jgi:hypothetical protein
MGIGALPEGRRRSALAATAELMFAEEFAGRVLPFEARAAARYSEVVIARRQAGKPIEKFDARSRRPRSRQARASSRGTLVVLSVAVLQ